MRSSKTLTSTQIFDLLRDDLQKVEEEFGQQTVSNVPKITEIGQYLQAGGGKRLRPGLVLLASKLCGYSGPAVIRLGAVVELIHTATLVHDDIIDGAETRRGRPSTNSRWGNHMSVLAGDWLYMQAFNVALGERQFKILDLLIGLTQVMVEGELLQLTMLRKLKTTEEEYFELSYRKTACLFSACMRLGAILGRQSEGIEMKLGSYGINLGMAFQVVDDLLDFTSSEEKIGKPVGSDLREGKLTLPLIYLLERCSEAESTVVKRVLDEGGFHSVSFPEILDLMDRHGALKRSRDKARDLAEQARAALATFTDSPYKDALRSLPEFILEREF